jgi:hypothetical protein
MELKIFNVNKHHQYFLLKNNMEEQTIIWRYKGHKTLRIEDFTCDLYLVYK